MTITTTCPFCGEAQNIVVESDQLKAYLGGALAQTAFPTLTADEREAIISGVCPPCWETL